MTTGGGRPRQSGTRPPHPGGAPPPASVIASAQRVTGRKHAIWFGTAWSAPTSRPTRSEATSDMISTIGTEPAYDSTSGVMALVAPGPVVTTTTPPSPDARPYPTAVQPAPASWRPR